MGRSVKLTTHLHVQPRLRMNEAIPLVPLYAFMVWQERLVLAGFRAKGQCINQIIHMLVLSSARSSDILALLSERYG